MQLIAEAENTLDIEINMSTADNIEDNTVNLDIEELHNKNFNGNEQITEDNNTDEDESKKQVVSVIDKVVENGPTKIENGKITLSQVDLSEIISEENNLQNNKQTEESLEDNLIKDTDKLDTSEKEINNEPQEEDYLEDDIISIREEPFEEITQLPKESECPVKETESVKSHENDNVEDLEETNNSSSQIESEVLNKKTVQDTNMDEVSEEVISSPIQCESKSGEQIEPIEENIECIEKQETIIVDCDDVVKDKSETKLEEKSPDQVEKVHPIELENSSMEVINEAESMLYNNKTNSPLIDNEGMECDNISSPEEKEKGETKINKEANDISITSENKINFNGEVVKESTITIDNDEVEVIDDEESPVQCENKTDLPKEVESTTNKTENTESMEIHKGDDSNSTEILESESVTKVSNIDAINSPIALKDDVMEVDELKEKSKEITESADSPIELKDDMDVEEVIENTTNNKEVSSEVTDTVPVNTTNVNSIIDKPVICKLSNTLDIFSDEEDEELPKLSILNEPPPQPTEVKEKQCIDIEDDDDIMLIDEDTNKVETNTPVETNEKTENLVQPNLNTEETGIKTVQENSDSIEKDPTKETTPPPAVPEINDTNIDIDIKEKSPEPKVDKIEPPTPLVPDNFLNTAKKKLSDMTRDDLEEFCILKIVESVVDRSNLSDIKNKLKSMTQGLDEYRKKAMMLTKQNRDLQVVLKSVQEEQKKVMGNMPITPLKITRSVGMQVFMEKTPRKKGQQQNIANKNLNLQNKVLIPQGPRQQKQPNQNIPVPRLVPANNPGMKTPNMIPQVNQVNSPAKNVNQPNGMVKNPPPLTKAEKRPHNKLASSVTVDLTDDEPPSKVPFGPTGPKGSPAAPVRVVPPQNLMVPQRPFGPGVNSPRKVYIPISGPQNQPLRPGQTIMLKTVHTPPGIRPRCPTPQISRVEPNRMGRMSARHPAPLPMAMKQYQPPNWKSLPPAPDLKLSKVDNGIVISWKIEDVPEDSYEEIASYQLYAYQETAQPPNTTLWKKIGDVKALPLPMACTLTQFMAGFKYYFAVRAVDIRSRLGPFSLPGSILLLNKNI